MTNDLISQAEALLGRFAALKEHAKLKPNAVIFEMINIRDALIAMVPGLAEEIKRLQVLECAAKANTTRRDEDIGDLMKELSKWQQIAIEERANWLYAIESTGGYDMVKVSDLCNEEVATPKRSQAAKELGLQYTFKTAYEPNGPIEINGERYVRESEQKAYIDRLEAAYLDMWRISLSDKDGNLTPDQLKELNEAANNMLQLQAQAALEKIREKR